MPRKNVPSNRSYPAALWPKWVTPSELVQQGYQQRAGRFWWKDHNDGTATIAVPTSQGSLKSLEDNPKNPGAVYGLFTGESKVRNQRFDIDGVSVPFDELKLFTRMDKTFFHDKITFSNKPSNLGYRRAIMVYVLLKNVGTDENGEVKRGEGEKGKKGKVLESQQSTYLIRLLTNPKHRHRIAFLSNDACDYRPENLGTFPNAKRTSTVQKLVSVPKLPVATAPKLAAVPKLPVSIAPTKPAAPQVMESQSTQEPGSILKYESWFPAGRVLIKNGYDSAGTFLIQHARAVASTAREKDRTDKKKESV